MCPGGYKSPGFFVYLQKKIMYTIKTINEIKKSGQWELAGYKLCYIDSIAETYRDYTPDAKAYRETDEWKEQHRLREEKFQREGHMSSYDPQFGFMHNPVLDRGSEIQDYPNPEFIPGEQEYYAYFTPIDLSDQWGDDWDDAPYEYNAGVPSDSEKDKDGEWKEYEIIKVPFYVRFDGWNVKQPRDWGGSNSQFCVRDINAGAIAWIYAKGEERKTCDGIAVHAGMNPLEFIDRVQKINKLYPREDD